MSKSNSIFTSIVKKYIMGLSGLFLIVFLLIHAFLNALVFLNDNGKTFEEAAHFMGSNPLMRILEIGLVIGFIIHIIDGFVLWSQNKKARPQSYQMIDANKNSTWYSRSMGLLGTILLLFLITHAKDFWIPNRYNQFLTGHELSLFHEMKNEFNNWLIVIVYILACFSLFWHLLHGFRSAFQSLGFYHSKYNDLIKKVGVAFSVCIPLIFASIPLAFKLGLIK